MNYIFFALKISWTVSIFNYYTAQRFWLMINYNILSSHLQPVVFSHSESKYFRNLAHRKSRKWTASYGICSMIIHYMMYLVYEHLQRGAEEYRPSRRWNKKGLTSKIIDNFHSISYLQRESHIQIYHKFRLLLTMWQICKYSTNQEQKVNFCIFFFFQVFNKKYSFFDSLIYRVLIRHRRSESSLFKNMQDFPANIW